MNRINIEFASSSSGTAPCGTPWDTTGNNHFRDQIIRPDLSSRRYSCPSGETWVRIVPALLGSRNWMLGVHALTYANGQHSHAKTIGSGTKSVFDKAQSWFMLNRPEALYSKANRSGYNLQTKPLCLCWIIVHENGKTVARLLQASGFSGYTGSKGFTPGLGHQIWQLAHERDEHGDLVADLIDHANGLQLCIRKDQPSGSRYPTYSLRRGQGPAPMGKILEQMDPAEISALTRLEDVVYLPDEETEWKILGNIIGRDTVSKIRAAHP